MNRFALKEAAQRFKSDEIVIVHYCEYNGRAQEIWSQYYILHLANEYLLSQISLLRKFFTIFRHQLQERYSISLSGSVDEYFYFIKLFTTSFYIETVDPNDRINVKCSEYKASTISQYIANELPHYNQVVQFLQKYGISIPRYNQNNGHRDDWTAELKHLFEHSDDAFKQVFRLIYRKFGDCSEEDEVIIEKSRDCNDDDEYFFFRF